MGRAGETHDHDRRAIASAAGVRLGAVAFNALAYALSVGAEDSSAALAYGALAAAALHALLLVSVPPGRPVARVVAAGPVTVALDAVLIAAFVGATGGLGSPFYLLWYLSITDIALRHRWETTVVAGGVHAASYLAVLAAVGDVAGNLADIAVRLGYIVLVAAAGGLLAARLEAAAKARVKSEASAAVLEEEVRRRTKDLEASRAELASSLAGLRDAHERLKGLDELKTRFINTAAHELGTPMTPILLQVDVLREAAKGRIGPEGDEALTVLDRNVRRLRTLIRDVLDSARLQAGRLTVRHAPVDLRDVVEEAFAAFRETADRQGIVLQRLEPASLPVEADRARLLQVLFNLLSNAIKFTPRGGRVTIVLGAEDEHAVVTVRDTGVGLGPEQKAEMFKPFVQPHGGGEGGTGLGLYISRGIVEEHGGEIWVESAGAGRGAAFSFRIPRRAAARAEPSAEAPGGVERRGFWPIVYRRCPRCGSDDIDMSIRENRYACGLCAYRWR